MSPNREPETYKLLWSARRNKKQPPVPERYSSAVCWYWTDLDRTDTPNTPAEQDSYLETLKQQSATHRPSLDSLPLHRSTVINEPKPRPSDTVPPKDGYAGPAGDRAEASSSSHPQVTGQRYHRLANGRIYAEFVNALTHDSHDHQTSEARVRSATGMLPVSPPPDSGHSPVPKVGPLAELPPFHYPPDNHTPPAAPHATTPPHPSGQTQENREARRRRWLHWHISKHTFPAPPHAGDGAADLAEPLETTPHNDVMQQQQQSQQQQSAVPDAATAPRQSRNLTESSGADAIYRAWSAPGFHGALSAREAGRAVVVAGCEAEHVALVPGRVVRKGKSEGEGNKDGNGEGREKEGLRARLRGLMHRRSGEARLGRWRLRRRDAWRVEEGGKTNGQGFEGRGGSQAVDP